MVKSALNRELLRKRLKRLLRLEREKSLPNASASLAVHRLQSVGDVVLIGGAIRDVARRGVRTFRSDLDFVVYGNHHNAFIALMQELHATPNRFGGFGLRVGKLKMDVWHIDDTWAKTRGIRYVDTPQDLLSCVFFDWDAILYDVRSSEIISNDDYFDKVHSNIMGLCLEENPNISGSFVRAIRRAALWDVRFGSDLTNFSLNTLNKIYWKDLVDLDRRAFPFPVLRDIDPTQLIDNLKNQETLRGHFVSHPVRWRPTQLELPLSGTAETGIRG